MIEQQDLLVIYVGRLTGFFFTQGVPLTLRTRQWDFHLYNCMKDRMALNATLTHVSNVFLATLYII